MIGIQFMVGIQRVGLKSVWDRLLKNRIHLERVNTNGSYLLGMWRTGSGIVPFLWAVRL
jgi:hypothetical protein